MASALVGFSWRRFNTPDRPAGGVVPGQAPRWAEDTSSYLCEGQSKQIIHSEALLGPSLLRPNLFGTITSVIFPLKHALEYRHSGGIIYGR